LDTGVGFGGLSLFQAHLSTDPSRFWARHEAAVPAALAARELALQCRLNAACLALEAAKIPFSKKPTGKTQIEGEKALVD